MMTRWNVEEMTGYKPMTTFWEDFCIAEMFGSDAVKDTFNRAFKEWKGNYKYLTELVMVTNHKIWYWADRNELFAAIYEQCWATADGYACDNLKGEEANYFYRVTD